MNIDSFREKLATDSSTGSKELAKIRQQAEAATVAIEVFERQSFLEGKEAVLEDIRRMLADGWKTINFDLVSHTHIVKHLSDLSHLLDNFIRKNHPDDRGVIILGALLKEMKYTEERVMSDLHKLRQKAEALMSELDRLTSLLKQENDFAARDLNQIKAHIFDILSLTRSTQFDQELTLLRQIIEMLSALENRGVL